METLPGGAPTRQPVSKPGIFRKILVQKTVPEPLYVAPQFGAEGRSVCRFTRFLDTAEADLGGIGGEVLAGSGFENEDPEIDFAADVVTAIAANQRED